MSEERNISYEALKGSLYDIYADLSCDFLTSYDSPSHTVSGWRERLLFLKIS